MMNQSYNTTWNGPTDTPARDPRSYAEVVVQTAFMLVIIFSSIFGNILILLAIHRNRLLRSITSVFVANLAVADFLLAIIGMPFTMASSITYEWVFGPHWCIINGMANSMFCIASMLSLAAVSIDRYIAILKPLKYHLIMTPRTAIMMIIYLWTHSILCAMLPMSGWSRYRYITNESICTADWSYNIPYTMFIFGSSFFLPLLVMTYSYYHILKTARRHSNEMAPKVGELSATPLRTVIAIPMAHVATQNTNTSPPRQQKSKEEQEAKEKFRRDTKAAKTLLIVMGTFLLCWSPHFVGMTCLLFPSCRWPDEFFATTTWLAMMNSGCNPILYGVLNRRFRQSFKEIIFCGRVSRRVDVDISLYRVERPRKGSRS